MSAHPHKKIIDAWTEDTSIEIEEQANSSEGPLWITVPTRALITRPLSVFRIKPKMRSVTVDGVKYEWPEPMRVAPEYKTIYWFISCYGRVECSMFQGCNLDKYHLSAGIAHATKEGAEAHRRALVAVSGGTLE